MKYSPASAQKIEQQGQKAIVLVPENLSSEMVN